jgi:hypothetical protein
MKDEYTCALCKVQFRKGWTEQESWTEAFATFPADDLMDWDLVCSGCYEILMDWARANAPELLKESA